MSWNRDHEYKYILHACDHFSRFSWGYPLKTKASLEVASNLFELFTTFGAPAILQSDNGKEFTSKIINRRPRHPQSQGLVERGNSVLKTKLGKWMEDNNRNDWSFGLKIVIYGMNTSVSRPTKSTLYCLAFNTSVSRPTK